MREYTATVTGTDWGGRNLDPCKDVPFNFFLEAGHKGIALLGTHFVVGERGPRLKQNFGIARLNVEQYFSECFQT